MVESTARKSIPGRNAHLPPFIVERMEELGHAPTLTRLALGMGISKSTLSENLRGINPTKLETAIKMRDFLKCDLTELVEKSGLS